MALLLGVKGVTRSGFAPSISWRIELILFILGPENPPDVVPSKTTATIKRLWIGLIVHLTGDSCKFDSTPKT